MSGTIGFETHQLQATIRFIQGYRYLDRCGEALVQLEKTLAEGWIPTEPMPQSGTLKNDQLGMFATFNAEAMSSQQHEFLSFEYFRDQTCKLYEVLWRTFEIERINVPVLQVVLQKGFQDGELEEATRDLVEMQLCTPHPALGRLVEGEVSAMDLTMVATKEIVWSGQSVQQRRRLTTSVVRQEKQTPFDVRLLKRVKLLPKRQQEALAALMRLKRQHPEMAPVAIQIGLENSLELDFNAADFDLPAFLEQSWNWAETVRNALSNLERSKPS